MKKLQIAVGIIRNPQGEIFITQRAADAHMANKLEFPGGKIESDETPEQALIRELQEEVGITVTTSSLFDKLEYQFPDRHITLWFSSWKVGKASRGVKKGSRVGGWRDQRWIRRRFLRRMNRLSANLSPRAEPRVARLTRQRRVSLPSNQGLLLAPVIAIGEIPRAGDALLFRSPFSQIDQLAALATERTKRTLLAPHHSFAAGRAVDDSLF